MQKLVRDVSAVLRSLRNSAYQAIEYLHVLGCRETLPSHPQLIPQPVAQHRPQLVFALDEAVLGSFV